MQTKARLEAAREEYLLNCQIDGKSKGTLKIYDRATCGFYEFLNGTEISPQQIRGFIFWLQERYNPTTVSITVRALRTFIGLLVENECIVTDPMAKIRTPKVPKKYPNVLTEEEVSNLLSAVKSNPRDNAILTFMIDTGVRAGELCGLKLDDISLATRSAKIFGKNSKERFVYFSPVTAKALARWLANRPEQLWEDHLFLNWQGDPLNDHSLWRIVTRSAERAKIQTHTTPITCRHTFATLMAKSGADVYTIQRLLGHASITTSMIYVELSGRDLREKHAECSPIMRLERQRRS